MSRRAGFLSEVAATLASGLITATLNRTALGQARASTRNSDAGSRVDCRVKPGNDKESSECVSALL
jgi:hypothetical protein